jgi:hypothetical protein
MGGPRHRPHHPHVQHRCTAVDAAAAASLTHRIRPTLRPTVTHTTPHHCARRAHPEEVRKFYALVDEFHRMWDVVTEFDSLSNLATQMVPVSSDVGGVCSREGEGVLRVPRVWAVSLHTLSSAARAEFKHTRSQHTRSAAAAACAAGLSQAPHECAGPCCQPHRRKRHRRAGGLACSGLACSGLSLERMLTARAPCLLPPAVPAGAGQVRTWAHQCRLSVWPCTRCAHAEACCVAKAKNSDSLATRRRVRRRGGVTNSGLMLERPQRERQVWCTLHDWPTAQSTLGQLSQMPTAPVAWSWPARCHHAEVPSHRMLAGCAVLLLWATRLAN